MLKMITLNLHSQLLPSRAAQATALLLSIILLLAVSEQLAQAQPTKTYRVQLGFRQRLLGFDTCEQPPQNTIIVEKVFQLKLLPANATLYLHLYSVDQCAAYFSVYVNDYIIADHVHLGQEGDVYLPLRIPVNYLREGENTVRIVLLRECHKECFLIWCWLCGVKHFYLYNDSFIELVYRAATVTFDCRPRVCREFSVTVIEPLGSVQTTRLTGVPVEMAIPEKADVNFTVKPREVEAGPTRWLLRGYETKKSGLNAMVVAVYTTYHYVNVSTAVSRALGGGWYEANSTATVSIADTVVELPNRTRFVFTGWQGSLNSSSPSVQLKVDSPKELTALWAREYYVVAGAPLTGCSGWYREGSLLSCEIPEVIQHSSGSREVLREVYLNSKPAGRKPQVVVREPLNVSAEYVGQYLVNTSTLVYLGPFAISAELPVAGGGWYDAGNSASVKASREAMLLLFPLVFERWLGDLQSDQETISFTVDSPKHLVAIYRVPSYILGGLLALLVAVPVVYHLTPRLPTLLLSLVARAKTLSVSRNIRSFHKWLEQCKRLNAEVSSSEALRRLEDKVERPLESLKSYFGGVKRYEEIRQEVAYWHGILEWAKKWEKKLTKEELVKLVERAKIWEVECKNLHHE
jgi:hypothetical protein